MQADLFFETSNPKAIALHLITQNEWEMRANELTSAERNAFSLRQFKGALGDYCLMSNADGLIDKAYIGSGRDQQAQALAHAAVLLPQGTYELQGTLKPDAAVHWALAQYRFLAYKKYELKPRQLIVKKEELAGILNLAQSLFLVRDLINKPCNDLGPQQLAEVLEQLANTHQAQFKQWVGDELLRDNFPAIHAVGRASASSPRLLSLTWGEAHHPHIVLIGKGVCFDSGGLDIKPSSNMRLMKKDMGGAAHVIGLAQWVMRTRLAVRLEVLIPAVENAIGPDAFRPGDVLIMRNGLSVEVDNTDAEGRLVLADALAKACENKPQLLIDFATLTGAARVAVGTEIAAMCSNCDDLAAAISESARQTADPVWRLPLHSAYDDLLSSNIADIANGSASPYAGAIVAGLFLQRFITPSIPWVHFDVMAWNLSSKPGRPEGGEAMAVRAVADYLSRRYAPTQNKL